jgi:hypothetical protein
MRLVSVKILSLMIVFSMIASGFFMAAEPMAANQPTEPLTDTWPEDEIFVDTEPMEEILGSSYPFPSKYPTLAEYYAWFDQLEAEYPHLINVTCIGYSVQGRKLLMLEITSDEASVVGYKPAIYINGNIHAREWSTSQAASYLAWYLLENYDSNETIFWLLNNRRVYILPVSNPDGYVYDGDGAYPSYMGWRKNRRNNGDGTYGVDLNRNWDVDWASGDYVTSSDTYHGPYAFSEPETQAMKRFIENYSIDSFQDLHTYAGTLLVPLCYSASPAVHDQWYREATARMTSFTTRLGTSNTYTYGQPIQTIGYTAPGGSIDWTYEKLGIQSYCFEFYTGTAQDITGFYPDPSLIMTINKDVDDALIYQARISDVDLGDGTTHQFPPTPYIVFGNVFGPGGEALAGETVTVINTYSGEDISIQSDSNGYYELNLGTLTQYGYNFFDSMAVSVGPYSVDFAVDGSWGKRIDLNTVATNVPITVQQHGPGNSTDTFSLYPRGIRQEVKYNGLAAYSLSKVQSVSTDYYHTSFTAATDTYAGIRAWRRSSAGTETEITYGTAVAVASRAGLNGQGLISANYAPPTVNFNDGDSLVVRLYVATTSGGLTTARATFITEPMGPGTLQNSQWTVSYYIRRGDGRVGGLSGSYVAWGASMFNTNIANFRYSTVSIPKHHNTVNWTDAGAGVTNYWVYRSNTVSGDYELLGSVPAGTHTYVDKRKGQYDTTYWWYRVMAAGLEGKGFVAEQEPGGTETGFATATGPIGGPSNVASITITYFWTGAPTSVYLYYTTNGGASYTQLAQLSGAAITGSYSWTIPADGEYGWYASAQGGGSTDPVPPTSGTWPEASYYLDITPPGPPTNFIVNHWGPTGTTDTYSETRYLRGVANEVIVNGLTSYSLSTVNSGTAGNWAPGNNLQIHLGIRVFKRNSSATETEITTSISATVSRTVTGNGYQSGTWTPPETQLNPTDSIVVRVYGDTTSPPTTLRATFTTGQLGATRLDSSQWTVQYWTRMALAGGGGSDWYWGTATYENKINGFTYSNVVPGDPLRHNTLNWTHDGTDVDHFNIYRSDSQFGTYTLIGTAPAGTNYYVDLEKGQADATAWWYIVRAEDALGNEEQNDFAVQEPGTGTPYSINLAGKSNWVFVSYPVTVTGHIETVFNDTANGDAGTNWDVAKTWSNQQKRWLTYRKGGTANTFTNLNNTMGVWLHLTANGADQALQLPSTGAYPGSITIYLYAGWNLVGYPSATARLASNTLPGAADMVSEWQATSPYIVDKAPGAVTMTHGNGYWVRVTADCAWTVQP